MPFLAPLTCPECVLSACRSRLATAAKIPDFSSKDIFLPTPQRTRILLSAIINFIKFSEQCAPVVQTVRKKAEDLGQESESLMRERVRLETQLAQVQCGSSNCPFDPPRASDIFFLNIFPERSGRRTNPELKR